MRTRKYLKALRLLQDSERELAATLMQKHFRAALARARARLLQKQYELSQLQEQAEVTIQDHTHAMSVDDRRRMYKLQDELKLTAKELVNKRLLLRPNTTFAVVWKVLFVICVILEITQLALQPKLKQYKDKETGQPMDLGEIMVMKYVPSPVPEWKECAPWLIDEEEEEKERSRPVFGALKKERRRREETEKPRPWYCQEPYVTAQSIYINILRFILLETSVIVGIVCFMDVFVTFFTGEFDPDTGLLVPKPLFQRWIIPGLVLQLLVNPKMETTSHYVGLLLNGIVRVGPIRAYRWTAALFYPLFRVLIFLLQNYVWQPLVDYENKHHILISTSKYTMRPIDNEISQIRKESSKDTLIIDSQ